MTRVKGHLDSADLPPSTREFRSFYVQHPKDARLALLTLLEQTGWT